ncbi:MAG: hypothetical protein R2939_14455 [Kofleriaceae bacterium]
MYTRSWMSLLVTGAVACGSSSTPSRPAPAEAAIGARAPTAPSTVPPSVATLPADTAGAGLLPEVLAGVRFGMSIDELRAARPAATASTPATAAGAPSFDEPVEDLFLARAEYGFSPGGQLARVTLWYDDEGDAPIAYDGYKARGQERILPDGLNRAVFVDDGAWTIEITGGTMLVTLQATRTTPAP